ncbi:helix-hairpin-helix domain-containing protein [Desulfamplus magnetovallimortis]|uniref:helix-hairpin-helix domain-containing protein n=1 Tax=Desulfamplus magnetovallimortis TaxID=1246637 RepID=UPI0009BA98CF|nr:helix-hairpin-helix domain-containing protein [Desulfamplus magnetovallimortis]
MLRGEKEGILTIHLLPSEENAINCIAKLLFSESPKHSFSESSKKTISESPQKTISASPQKTVSASPQKTVSQSPKQSFSESSKQPFSKTSWVHHLQLAIRDSYKRLLGPAMENETIKAVKEIADDAAIKVFTGNIKELLMSPPLGQKAVLAIDPGFRTGCKVVCLNRQGDLLAHDVIFPMAKNEFPQQQKDGDKTANKGLGDNSSNRDTVNKSAGKKGGNKTSDKIIDLVKRYKIEAIAIGNGTAGRETLDFVKSIDLPSDIPVIMVDESGASIYSASSCAREEFPDHDITVRGAVSIGRRLMDPLAELVKIDPKSIGVGQYQHDVDQKKLQQALDDAVTTCVNKVGVELNTASRELLCQVAGLNRTTALNIVQYRNENGPFKSRKMLLKVPRLGPKAFEQCAGFLRIHNGENPLDKSGIHPESYDIVKKMALDLGIDVKALVDTSKNSNLVKSIELKRYVTEKTGIPTLQDIQAELLRPGRDPRESFTIFSFAEDVHTISDLVPGMKLPGIITNVTAFGAFVDIGVHQDGLVHVSQLADHFVKNPADEVKVRQKVNVTVMDVDIKRKRISLSMKGI